MVKSWEVYALNKIIKNQVNKLIKKYNTHNAFEIADELGIIVIKEPLDDNINGFYQYFKRNRIIYINSKLDEHNQLIVASHELGHAILHSKLNIVFLEENTFCVKNRYEKEANMFAIELLLQDKILNQYIGYTLDQISAAESIPLELLKLKFKV